MKFSIIEIAQNLVRCTSQRKDVSFRGSQGSVAPGSLSEICLPSWVAGPPGWCELVFSPTIIGCLKTVILSIIFAHCTAVAGRCSPERCPLLCIHRLFTQQIIKHQLFARHPLSTGITRYGQMQSLHLHGAYSSEKRQKISKKTSKVANVANDSKC